MTAPQNFQELMDAFREAEAENRRPEFIENNISASYETVRIQYGKWHRWVDTTRCREFGFKYGDKVNINARYDQHQFGCEAVVEGVASENFFGDKDRTLPKRSYLYVRLENGNGYVRAYKESLSLRRIRR